MKRLVPLSIVAGALACFVAAGSAQAAPVSNVALGKLTTAGEASKSMEQVHWRRHHRWWHRRHHHRHHRHHWRRWWW